MWRPLGVLSLALVVASGCNTSQPLAATLEVRDASTHKPVPHALVQSNGTTLFAPVWHETMGLPPGSTVGPLPDPPSDQTTTDTDGRAHLTLAGSRPNQLVIIAAGHQPLWLLVEASATSIQKPIGWNSGPNTPPGAPSTTLPRLEARITPASAPTATMATRGGS